MGLSGHPRGQVPNHRTPAAGEVFRHIDHRGPERNKDESALPRTNSSNVLAHIYRVHSASKNRQCQRCSNRNMLLPLEAAASVVSISTAAFIWHTIAVSGSLGGKPMRMALLLPASFESSPTRTVEVLAVAAYIYCPALMTLHRCRKHDQFQNLSLVGFGILGILISHLCGYHSGLWQDLLLSAAAVLPISLALGLSLSALLHEILARLGNAGPRASEGHYASSEKGQQGLAPVSRDDAIA
jgi:hypothetical protein